MNKALLNMKMLALMLSVWLTVGALAQETSSYEVYMNEKGLYGYKYQDKIVIPCIYEMAYRFSDNRAVVKYNGRTGIINKEGNYVVTCSYNGASGFFAGLSTLKLGDKYGFVDTTGQIVVDFKYDAAWKPAGDDKEERAIALVKLNGKYGYIDKFGKEVLPCIYDDAWGIGKKGLARVLLNGKYGCVSFNGIEIIKPGFDDISWGDETMYCLIRGVIYEIRMADMGLSSPGTLLIATYRNCYKCKGKGGRYQTEYTTKTETEEIDFTNPTMIWDGHHYVMATGKIIEKYKLVPTGENWVECAVCHGSGCRGGTKNRVLKWIDGEYVASENK